MSEVAGSFDCHEFSCERWTIEHFNSVSFAWCVLDEHHPASAAVDRDAEDAELLVNSESERSRS
jgi:hypothetical protein